MHRYFFAGVTAGRSLAMLEITWRYARDSVGSCGFLMNFSDKNCLPVPCFVNYIALIPKEK